MTGLSYDGNQHNGIIFNTKYDWGAMYHGEKYRPALSFDYHSFECHEYFNNYYVIETDGTKRAMTDAEIAEVMTVAEAWEQPLGQEGNPTPEQAMEMELGQARQALDQAAQAIAGQVPFAEMASWPKQEAEARALDADPNALTPFLDLLVISRNLGETREQLAAKVIANADYYRDQFGGALGAYQKQCKDIEAKYAP